MNNEVLNLQIGYEIDNYTNQKYYILYIILKPEYTAINITYLTESLYDENTYKINIGFKDKEEITLFVNKKYLNKEFTFLKKRIAKKLNNYIIRVSNNKKIILEHNNHNLFNNFFYLDL